MLMKTFSKIFCPGFRIGWIIAPSPVIEKLVIAKQGTDLCTSAFVSILAAYLLQNGHIDRQIEIAREIYRRKCGIMLAALRRFMPADKEIRWSQPEGGMFLWLTLPEYMDTVEMLAEAIQLKVAYVNGSSFFYDGSGNNAMRLNYSYPSDEQIVVGIERIASLVGKRLRTSALRT